METELSKSNKTICRISILCIIKEDIESDIITHYYWRETTDRGSIDSISSVATFNNHIALYETVDFRESHEVIYQNFELTSNGITIKDYNCIKILRLPSLKSLEMGYIEWFKDFKDRKTLNYINKYSKLIYNYSKPHYINDAPIKCSSDSDIKEYMYKVCIDILNEVGYKYVRDLLDKHNYKIYTMIKTWLEGGPIEKYLYITVCAETKKNNTILGVLRLEYDYDNG